MNEERGIHHPKGGFVENKTILIVEDDGVLAVQLQNMLIKLGYSVPEPVATGEEAIAVVTAGRSDLVSPELPLSELASPDMALSGLILPDLNLPDLILPDLVLMDIHLAGEMDGITAAERICSVADIPIVFLTGFSQDHLLQRAKITAPYGYLVKPASQQNLAATIEMALYKHTLDRQLKESEARNRQLQKVESLGLMAGAIAHHFNNQLHVVMGSLEVTLDDLPRDSIILETLTEALKAAHKAAEVSGLMLTYLGQKPGKREPMDLSKVCRQSLPLLQAVIPNKVTLTPEIPSPGPTIRADAGQIQQVLTNLVTNAWEAAGENDGSICLTVKTVSLTDIPALKRFPIDWEPQEGVYACLKVSDTGCGITNADVEKLFDPFFTTKFTGRGLGLSVVIGIVQAHGGGVTVESELGRGSVFRVFLPVSTEEVFFWPVLPAIPGALQTAKTEKVSRIEGIGAVLLIEDEEPVRNMARMMLTRLGYTVFEAKDGDEGLEIFKQHQNEIRCVLSDLTMPRMNGWETIAALRKLSPDIPVILSSGYDEARVMADEHTERPNAFIGKPYQLKSLGAAIRRAVYGSDWHG
jgi:signal transduction histidine kinase/ActR/RegA family two-component response regulator